MGQILSVSVLAVLITAYFLFQESTCCIASPAVATLSNLKQLAVSGLMYESDWDDTLPLAFGNDRKGNHLWSTGMLFPFDWAAPTTADIKMRETASRVAWANALMSYMKYERGYEILD